MSAPNNTPAQPACLYSYRTGEYIRAATEAELSASIAAAEHDGGSGVIVVDGLSCYVQGGGGGNEDREATP